MTPLDYGYALFSLVAITATAYVATALWWLEQKPRRPVPSWWLFILMVLCALTVGAFLFVESTRGSL